ncbi:DUF4389 domain-containing protein [Kribbella ginsengisoli]|uniref:DUF4389 domain-containing protein n=1 Tax=Kribbella ginsengisoli TaxID=363865 RepID=A0ABP6YYF0_9ACTN
MKTDRYPVRLEGDLDPSVSRGLWLIKWLLAIPHYIVLAVLWLVFGVLSVVAFFAILFTGRYPRSIFTFTTGVLRWSWRVSFYAYSALGTDRYPPFTLNDVPDYPARLYVDEPPQLSRGLVLVKWLLAVPHLLIVAILLGGGPYLSYRFADSVLSVEGGGLIGLLTLIAGVALLFTGRYPRELFDFIIGLNRWVYRVAGYFFLMTDEYPPFRLDFGTDSSRTGGSPDSGRRPADSVPFAASAGAPQHPPSTHQWTAGRVISAVAGSLLILFGLGALPAGGTALWFDHGGRDAAGYVSTGTQHFSTSGYAIASETGAIRMDGPSWMMERFLGDVRITADSRTSTPVFIGIASERDASAYLATIEHSVVDRMYGHETGMAYHRQGWGSAPPQPPAAEGFWVAKSYGPGQQVLNWRPGTGDWTVVVLNADASRSVQADVTIGATIPWLDDVAYTLIAIGLVFLAGGGLLIHLAVRRTSAPVRGATS